MSFQPTPLPRRPGVLAVAILGTCVAVAGCSTRQVVDPLEGSTAQRLVTYSLDQFVDELLAQPEIAEMAGEVVRLDVHFLLGHPLGRYSERLIDTQLQLTHGIRVAAPDESATTQLDVFFNSMGTDNDAFGLTLPTLGLTPGASTINVLALDMYHGITEGYAVVRSEQGRSIRKTKRVLARIRRDNVSTPIIDFPINQLED